MIKVIKMSVVSILFSMLFACSQSYIPDVTESVDAEKICTQVKQMIESHSTGFEAIKGVRTVSRKLDVWQAKTHLVGQDCQIWRWSNGKQAYMCHRLLPDEETTRIKFDKAVEFSRQCLGTGWKEEKISREKTAAVRVVFSSQQTDTVASVHRIQNRGLLKDEWSLYYFIGDREKTL